MILIYLQSIKSLKKTDNPYRITALNADNGELSILNFRPAISSSSQTYEAQKLDRLDIISAPPFCDIADELIELIEDKRIIFSHAIQFKMMKSQFKAIGYNFNIKPTYLWFASEMNKLNNIEIYLKDNSKLHFQSVVYAENYVSLMHNFFINKAEGLKTEKINTHDKMCLEFSQFKTAAGVYFFLNESKAVIYVGKAKNVRKRLQSHFSTSKSDNKIDYSQVKDINVEYTGSDIIAQLIESENIKQLKPVFNTQQVTNPLPFLINKGKTAIGISKLKIVRKNHNDNLRERFFNRNSVKESIVFFCTSYDLCRKHCGIETTKGPCSNVTVKDRNCVCNGEESIEAYNDRFEFAFNIFKRRKSKIIYKLKGRSHDEDGFIYMVNDIYEGYGFIKKDDVIYNVNDILGHLIPKKNNYDTSRIVGQMKTIISQKNVYNLD